MRCMSSAQKKLHSTVDTFSILALDCALGDGNVVQVLSRKYITTRSKRHLRSFYNLSHAWDGLCAQGIDFFLLTNTSAQQQNDLFGGHLDLLTVQQWWRFPRSTWPERAQDTAIRPIHHILRFYNLITVWIHCVHRVMEVSAHAKTHSSISTASSGGGSPCALATGYGLMRREDAAIRSIIHIFPNRKL